MSFLLAPLIATVRKDEILNSAGAQAQQVPQVLAVTGFLQRISLSAQLLRGNQSVIVSNLFQASHFQSLVQR